MEDTLTADAPTPDEPRTTHTPIYDAPVTVTTSHDESDAAVLRHIVA